MRQMFRFAVDRDIIEFEPTASLTAFTNAKNGKQNKPKHGNH
jgi:hypothetical protein